MSLHVASKFNKVLSGFFSEAKTICGSEGLYQSVFHHHALSQYRQDQIRREEPAEGGNIDFLIRDDDRFYAIELKAGANSNRNSLANMKEVEIKGKGLQHDLAKLHSLHLGLPKPVESWLVCVDLSALGLAFSEADLEKYSRLSNIQGTHFAYFSQLENEYQTWVAGKRNVWELEVWEDTSPIDTWRLIEEGDVWRRFFAEVARDSGPECSHVGLFYHILRRAGLHSQQLSSHVFFNCNRYNTRSYYIPDFSVFGKEVDGQFQLYGNKHKTVENDQFKLPALVSILEFKGGNAFSASSIGARKKGIVADVEKLAEKIKPRIEAASSLQQRPKFLSKPKFTMVVTDSDPRLQSTIEVLSAKYNGTVNIRWSGEA